MTTRVLVVALVAGLLAAGVVSAADPTAPLAVGQAAPDFELGDQHGRSLRLSEVLARRDFVVVAFYVKAFTGG